MLEHSTPLAKYFSFKQMAATAHQDEHPFPFVSVILQLRGQKQTIKESRKERGGVIQLIKMTRPKHLAPQHSDAMTLAKKNK